MKVKTGSSAIGTIAHSYSACMHDKSMSHNSIIISVAVNAIALSSMLSTLCTCSSEI